MVATITDGWLAGAIVRTAREDHGCDDWLGASSGGVCGNTIQAGERYAEGEPNDTAGGFGFDRYCLVCVRRSYGGTMPELSNVNQPGTAQRRPDTEGESK